MIFLEKYFSALKSKQIIYVSITLIFIAGLLKPFLFYFLPGERFFLFSYWREIGHGIIPIGFLYFGFTIFLAAIFSIGITIAFANFFGFHGVMIVFVTELILVFQKRIKRHEKSQDIFIEMGFFVALLPFLFTFFERNSYELIFFNRIHYNGLLIGIPFVWIPSCLLVLIGLIRNWVKRTPQRISFSSIFVWMLWLLGNVFTKGELSLFIVNRYIQFPS